VRIKRCSVVLIEPREKLAFDLQSLCTGGAGIDAQIELFALAPHLHAEVSVTEAEVSVLNALVAAQWADFDDLTRRFGEPVLRSLLDKGLLIGDDEAGASVRARDEALRAAHWQPHSAVAHYFGRWRGVSTGDAAENAGLCSMTELAERLGSPPPHVLERVAPAARIALPVTETTPFDELLARRVTCRNFDSTKAVDRQTFSHLLRRVFGAQAAYAVHADNVVIKRTSPSGGGLHPTEAYLLVQRVEDIAPGLYHYHPIDHALEPLPPPADGDLLGLARVMVAAQDYYMNAPVMIVLVSRFARTFWKYLNHSKAYRVTILDAGHLSQTLYLSATEFGLGAFITAAMNEVDIEQAFGLDPLRESPLAVCGFGHRGAECATFEFDPNRRVWPQGVATPH